MTSESGSTALRAYRTRPNDHKSQMVLQALLIAAAWNFVMALAVTIYIRSWSGLLALPAEEGVPVLFFFSFFLGCDIHCLWRPTGGQESMFQRYHKAIIDRERYREILYKRYTTYHSSITVDAEWCFPCGCRPQQELLLPGFRERWAMVVLSLELSV